MRYIDSSIQRQMDDIYEILLLTRYCRHGGLVGLINSRLPNRLEEQEIINILCDICNALAELHAHCIIHRDLKIENILIDEQVVNPPSESHHRHNRRQQASQVFVLCDFGSATKKIYDRKANPNQSVQLVQDEIQKYTTLSYRSPEMGM